MLWGMKMSVLYHNSKQGFSLGDQILTVTSAVIFSSVLTNVDTAMKINFSF